MSHVPCPRINQHAAIGSPQPSRRTSPRVGIRIHTYIRMSLSICSLLGFFVVRVQLRSFFGLPCFFSSVSISVFSVSVPIRPLCTRSLQLPYIF
ncbi:hypothetical protein DENSPDRAFT_799031, partial [Dentipellis sp. KUC8613]